MAAPNNKTFRKRTRKGHPAGSRQNTESKKMSQVRATNKDPRHGSKKKVSLLEPSQEVKVTKVFKTPLEELTFIEADERLQDILDRDSENQVLTDDDKNYMEERLARHQVLCELLGIVEEDEDDDEYDED